MRALGLTALTVAMLFTGPAHAQTQPPAPPRPAAITNPSWASIPDAETMAEHHPGFAVMAGLDGVATLQCVARADGGLSACEVLRAEPRGLGFDRSALSLVPLFRVNPRTVDGEEAKAQIQFRIHFLQPEPEPSLPWAGPEPDAEHMRNIRIFIDQIAPDLEREFETLLGDLGVDADREDKVRAIVRQVHGEFLGRNKDAATLAMARLITPDQLKMLMSNMGYPPEPSEDALMRASDRVHGLGLEEMTRVKALYCAQFECPPLAPPASDAIRP